MTQKERKIYRAFLFTEGSQKSTEIINITAYSPGEAVIRAKMFARDTGVVAQGTWFDSRKCRAEEMKI